MQENNKFKIHKDSEIWNYEGKIEFTKELIEFFEEERKKVVRDDKSDGRHIAFEDLDCDSIYNSIVKKDLGVAEKVEINILMDSIYNILETLTEVEKRRFTLHKIIGFKIVEIAELENVDSSSVRETINSVQRKLRDIEKIYKE